jgi:hypothetical protein
MKKSATNAAKRRTWTLPPIRGSAIGGQRSTSGQTIGGIASRRTAKRAHTSSTAAQDHCTSARGSSASGARNGRT